MIDLYIEMANRSKRIVDRRVLGPIRIEVGRGHHQPGGGRGQATEHALLRLEGGLKNTKGLGRVGGTLLIWARQQRTGRLIREWKTRTGEAASWR